MGAWLNLLDVRAQVRSSLAYISCLSVWDGFEWWRNLCRPGLPFAFLGLCVLDKWLPRVSWLSLPYEVSWGPCTGSRFMGSCSASVLSALPKLILSVKVGRGLRWLWVSLLNGSLLPTWVLLPMGPSSPWVPPPYGSSSPWVPSSAALPI